MYMYLYQCLLKGSKDGTMVLSQPLTLKFILKNVDQKSVQNHFPFKLYIEVHVYFSLLLFDEDKLPLCSLLTILT